MMSLNSIKERAPERQVSEMTLSEKKEKNHFAEIVSLCDLQDCENDEESLFKN
jgi:hypothetical protein